MEQGATAGTAPRFTSDWTNRNIPYWRAVLRPLRDDRVEILEIGSYEGRSALLFLDLLPLAHVTCVDPFYGDYSDRFDSNTAGCNITKVTSRSSRALDAMQKDGRSFDIVYIDGAHDRQSVFADSALAWPLLKVSGLLIWDDYLWGCEQPSGNRPQHAIDLFCSAFAPCLEELHRDYQVIARKRSEWPIMSAPPASTPVRRKSVVRRWQKGLRRFRDTWLLAKA